MGNKIIKISLLIILYFFALALSFFLISLPLGIYSEIMMKLNEGGLEGMHLVVGAMNMLYFIGYLVVIIMLIQIIDSTNNSPFTYKNVKRFRIMGLFLTINAVYECIRGYADNKFAGIQIFSTGKGAITPLMMIGLISALMCFVIAEVFKKAVEIKSDNDLTI